MKNPWLEIPLSDYEGHMALPEVGQAKLLADLFADLLKRYRPESVAVLGCAAGNGFDRIPTTTRVVAIDLNNSYIDRLAERYRNRIPNLELIVADVQTDPLRIVPVDLVFAGLLFEYVDVGAVLERIGSMLKLGGILGTVVQLPSPSIPMVTPSPFRSLECLSAIMKPVVPGELKQMAEQHGLCELQSCLHLSAGGKLLAAQEFSRSTPNKSANSSSDLGEF